MDKIKITGIDHIVIRWNGWLVINRQDLEALLWSMLDVIFPKLQWGQHG
jgi:hypothetical protein